MTFRYLLPGLLAAAFVPVVHAADIGPYLGAGIGYADVLTDDNEDDIQDSLAAQGITANLDNDTDNFNWRIYGGYQAHQNYGVEFSYIKLGDIDLTAVSTGPTPVTVHVSSDIEAFEFVGTGAYPISQNWDLTARIGGVYYNADGDADVTGAVVANFDASDDGVAFTGGVGWTRQIGTNWIWRGGWQYVDVEEINHLFTTGIGYRFDW